MIGKRLSRRLLPKQETGRPESRWCHEDGKKNMDREWIRRWNCQGPVMVGWRSEQLSDVHRG